MILAMRFSVFKLFVQVLFLSITLPLQAQLPRPDIMASSTNDFMSKRKEVLQKILYSDASGHYALFAKGKYGKGKKSVRKFDLNLKPTSYNLSLRFPKKVREPLTVDVVATGDRLYHIWKVWAKEGIQHFAQEINLGTKDILPEKRISNIDYVNGVSTRTTSFVQRDQEERFHLFSEILGNPNGNVALQFDSFDDGFDHRKTTTYQLPYTVKQFSLQRVLPFKNDGFFVIGKKFFSPNKTKSVKQKEYEYVIYHLIDGEANLIHTITTDGTHMDGVASEVSDDHLVISAFKCNHNSSRPNGIYSFKYDIENRRKVIENSCMLPDSFYDYPELKDKKLSGIQIGFQNKKWLADGNYILKDIFSNQAQETIVVAEQEFYTQNVSPNAVGALMTPAKNFYSKDIVIFKLDKDGQLLWHTKIVKNQEWGDNTILSYYPVFKNNTLYLFYNGNYINPEVAERNFLNEQDAALICSVVNGDGSVYPKILEYYTEEYPNVILPASTSYKETMGAILFHRAPGNLKRQKFTQVKFR